VKLVVCPNATLLTSADTPRHHARYCLLNFRSIEYTPTTLRYREEWFLNVKHPRRLLYQNSLAVSIEIAGEPIKRKPMNDSLVVHIPLTQLTPLQSRAQHLSCFISGLTEESALKGKAALACIRRVGKDAISLSTPQADPGRQ